MLVRENRKSGCWVSGEVGKVKWWKALRKGRLDAELVCCEGNGKCRSKETYRIWIKLSVIINHDIGILRRPRFKICIMERPASTCSKAHGD
jgi:hypothetical protein